MKLYRFDVMYGNSEDPTDIKLLAYQVVRETEASYFIDEWGVKKRIPKNAYNAWAHATEKNALEHFIRRLKNRIRWYGYWKRTCNEALEIAEKNL